MKENESDEVWTGTLDGKYVITVTREAPYRGILKITEGDRVLHWKTVGLMYDAQFGPDIDDVELWQQMAVQFIDGRK